MAGPITPTLPSRCLVSTRRPPYPRLSSSASLLPTMIILTAVFAGLSALASLISMIPTLSLNPFVVMESAINIPRAFWQHIAKLEVTQPPQAYVAEDIAPTFTNSVAIFDPEAFQLDLFRPAGPPSIVMNVTKELALYQPAAILAPESDNTDDNTETTETICPVTYFSDLVFAAATCSAADAPKTDSEETCPPLSAADLVFAQVCFDFFEYSTDLVVYEPASTTTTDLVVYCPPTIDLVVYNPPTKDLVVYRSPADILSSLRTPAPADASDRETVASRRAMSAAVLRDRQVVWEILLIFLAFLIFATPTLVLFVDLLVRPVEIVPKVVVRVDDEIRIDDEIRVDDEKQFEFEVSSVFLSY